MNKELVTLAQDLQDNDYDLCEILSIVEEAYNLGKAGN